MNHKSFSSLLPQFSIFIFHWHCCHSLTFPYLGDSFSFSLSFPEEREIILTETKESAGDTVGFLRGESIVTSGSDLAGILLMKCSPPQEESYRRR